MDLALRFAQVELEFVTGCTYAHTFVGIGIECGSFVRNTTGCWGKNSIVISGRSSGFSGTFRVGQINCDTGRLGLRHILCGETAFGTGYQLVNEGNHVLRDMVFTLDDNCGWNEVVQIDSFTTVSLQLFNHLVNHESLGLVIHFGLADVRETRHSIRLVVYHDIEDVVGCVFQGVVRRFVTGVNP